MSEGDPGEGPQQWHVGDYVISDEPERFDADALHDFLEVEGYWALGRTREQTAVGAANSVALGAYVEDGSMVGGARIVTDRATFGYLTDVYVLAEHRGLGLGRALAEAACAHPSVAGIKRLLLVTPDAHELYRPLGFTELPEPQRWMELRNVPGGGTRDAGADDDTNGSGVREEADFGYVPAAGPTRYVAWEGSGLPDPRTAAVSQIAAHLLEIVTVEGPMTADRAYRLYIRASGSVRVTQAAKEPMRKALGRLMLRGQIKIDRFDGRGDDDGDEHQEVLRLQGAPAVVVRELGERSLYEVPLNEIAVLMAHKRTELLGRSGAGGGQPVHAVAGVIQQATQRRANPERLKRAVLDTYGLTRMTQAAERYLSAALDLLDEPGE